MTTRFCSVFALTALMCGTPGCASAQATGPRTFRSLVSAVPQAESTQVQELRIQWTTAPGTATGATAAAPVSNMFTLLQARTSAGGLRRERAPELSPTQLVVVLADAEGKELDWRIVADPSIIRAEVPGPDGRLSGQIVQQASTELLVAVPGIRGAARIDIYRPVWNGRDYTLTNLGGLPLDPLP